ALETKTENGKTEETRRKRTTDEMKQIEELAKAAIGFDAQRGDQFSLQNITFTLPNLEVPAAPGRLQRVTQFAERWTGVLRYIALSLLFIMIYLLILRPVKKQVLAMLEAPMHPTLPASPVPGDATALTGEVPLASNALAGDSVPHM